MMKLVLTTLGFTLLLLPTAVYGSPQGRIPSTSDGNASPLPVNLGVADEFVILAKSGIATIPTSRIFGDIGVSPIAATAITGFSLIADVSTVFSKSAQVSGKVYAADYAAPTPARLTTAISNMEAAYTDARGRAPDVTELGAGDIGGMTLTRGVYKWTTGLLIPTDITLSGSNSDVWIFQIAQTLTVSSATRIILIGGAKPSNIFWQVTGAVSLGTTSRFEGIILAKTAITIQNGSAINGGLFSQTAVNLNNTTVMKTYPTGVSAYGQGTPGCRGTLGMGVNVPAFNGSVEFAVLCTNAPINSLGVAVISDTQDLAGTFVADWGILIHVDITSLVNILPIDMSSDGTGLGFGPLPFPNSPILVGLTFFAQSLWIETTAENCSPSPLELLSSNALTIVIQP